MVETTYYIEDIGEKLVVDNYTIDDIRKISANPVRCDFDLLYTNARDTINNIKPYKMLKMESFISKENNYGQYITIADDNDLPIIRAKLCPNKDSYICDVSYSIYDSIKFSYVDTKYTFIYKDDSKKFSDIIKDILNKKEQLDSAYSKEAQYFN